MTKQNKKIFNRTRKAFSEASKRVGNMSVEERAQLESQWRSTVRREMNRTEATIYPASITAWALIYEPDRIAHRHVYPTRKAAREALKYNLADGIVKVRVTPISRPTLKRKRVRSARCSACFGPKEYAVEHDHVDD